MKKLSINTFAVRFTLMALASSSSAYAANPDESNDAGTDGRSLYVSYQCWQCHGYEAQGGAAPRLANKEYSFQAFARLVRFPTLMPAYTTELLSDEKLQSILEFVQSLPPTPDADSIPALQY